MSRPDLQPGFNGWQAIDPTPPPKHWKNNSGGKLSLIFMKDNFTYNYFLLKIKNTEDPGLSRPSVGDLLPSSLSVAEKLDSLTIPHM